MKTVSSALLLILACALPAAVHAAPSVGKNYEKHCGSCHGADGRGQTRLGKKSGAKDLTDKAAAAKLSDEEAFKVIKFGRKDKKGEETMEAFGKELSDPEITELVAYVRKFAK